MSLVHVCDKCKETLTKGSFYVLNFSIDEMAIRSSGEIVKPKRAYSAELKGKDLCKDCAAIVLEPLLDMLGKPKKRKKATKAKATKKKVAKEKKVTKEKTTKKRGRPKGSKNKPKDGTPPPPPVDPDKE
jgi:hypothetical protein